MNWKTVCYLTEYKIIYFKGFSLSWIISHSVFQIVAIYDLIMISRACWSFLVWWLLYLVLYLEGKIYKIYEF